MRRRHAFTLVELLVVIAIIGVLAGLILPAISRTRETARRLQCLSHIRQVGMAVIAFHDAKTYLPPSRTDDGSLGPGIAPHSWVTLILPYIDQEPLQKNINSNVPWNAAVNLTPIQTRLEVFECPSSVLSDFRTTALGGAAPAQAPTDYVPISEVDNGLYSNQTSQNPVPPIVPSDPNDPTNSVWASGRPLAQRVGVVEANGSKDDLTDVEDGLSSTILLCEVSSRPSHYIEGLINELTPAQQIAAGLDLTGWANPSNAIRLNGSFTTRNPLTVTSPGPCPLGCTNNVLDPGTRIYSGGEVYSFHP
ncbi:MAG: DUF1559 domain-containing protein [Planctomycetales bacterium]|nr:DUF1559 domain-containing protein [Planctomycetales bacterium]